MKTSVYVPDDLWASLRALNPSANASHLLREGIDRWIRRDDVPAELRKLTPELIAARDAARAAAAAKVTAAYQEGYGLGLDFVAGLPWEVFAVFEQVGFDPSRLRETLKSDKYESEFALDDEPGFVFDFDLHWSQTVGGTLLTDDPSKLSSAIRQGFRDAASDVWGGGSGLPVLKLRDWVPGSARTKSSQAAGGNGSSADEPQP